MAVSLLAAATIAAPPLLAAPSAHAEGCAEAGVFIRVGGCTDLAGDAVDAAVVGAAVDHPLGWGPLPPGALAYPAFRGEAPCFLPDGQPYYTPGTEPCFPV